MEDVELIAQQVSGLVERFEALERRVAEVEKVNARLEAAALTTARALEEIASHWDAVYEAMRRQKNPSFELLAPRASSPQHKLAG